MFIEPPIDCFPGSHLQPVADLFRAAWSFPGASGAPKRSLPGLPCGATPGRIPSSRPFFNPDASRRAAFSSELSLRSSPKWCSPICWLAWSNNRAEAHPLRNTSHAEFFGIHRPSRRRGWPLCGERIPCVLPGCRPQCSFLRAIGPRATTGRAGLEASNSPDSCSRQRFPGPCGGRESWRAPG